MINEVSGKGRKHEGETKVHPNELEAKEWSGNEDRQVIAGVLGEVMKRKGEATISMQV